MSKDNKQAITMHITEVSNGFVITAGCKTFVTTSIENRMSDIQKYFDEHEIPSDLSDKVTKSESFISRARELLSSVGEACADPGEPRKDEVDVRFDRPETVRSLGSVEITKVINGYIIWQNENCSIVEGTEKDLLHNLNI